MPGELLFHTRILGEADQFPNEMPAQAAVATALVIGGYCPPNRPLPPSAQATFERLRKAYAEQPRP